MDTRWNIATVEHPTADTIIYLLLQVAHILAHLKEWGSLSHQAFDNTFVERLWRTVKYEDIFIRDYPSVPALTHGLEAYFRFYNHERYHQSLDYAVPAAVHFAVKEPELGAS